MRQRSLSTTLATALVAARTTQEGQKIALPPDHEAFPHPGLGGGMLGLWGASAEGTTDYALWRKAGAVALPAEGTSPESEPSGYATLSPQ